MDESKITLTHRLQKEGRWDEASQAKDQCISKLRAEGKTRSEAQVAAWEAMAEKFPPLACVEPDSIVAEELDVDLVQLANLDSPEFHADAKWVYQHLLVRGVKFEDAPSPGAWAMLQWAKRNQNRFFENVMPKAVAAKEKATEAVPGELPDEYRQDTSEIKKMLADHHLQWEQEAVADTAQAVKDKVAAEVSDWRRRFGLELPGEACESWGLQMIELADDLIHAALKHPQAYRTRRQDKFCD